MKAVGLRQVLAHRVTAIGRDSSSADVAEREQFGQQFVLGILGRELLGIEGQVEFVDVSHEPLAYQGELVAVFYSAGEGIDLVRTIVRWIQ